jgi:hypothetical protein
VISWAALVDNIDISRAEIETVEPELPKFGSVLLGVPARLRRQLIVGQPVGTLFGLAPAPRDRQRNGCRRQPFPSF